MATKKAKKPAAKKSVAKKPVKKAPVRKKAAVRSASTGRKQFITRTDEYSQLTWVLICVWLVLIAVFLGTVIGQMG